MPVSAKIQQHSDFRGRAGETTRELLEAYEIRKYGDNGLRQTSVYLHKKEITFSSTCLRDYGAVVYFSVFSSINFQLKFSARPVHSSLGVCIFSRVAASL